MAQAAHDPGDHAKAKAGLIFSPMIGINLSELMTTQEKVLVRSLYEVRPNLSAR
jgi:hypothetical protein